MQHTPNVKISENEVKAADLHGQNKAQQEKSRLDYTIPGEERSKFVMMMSFTEELQQ